MRMKDERNSLGRDCFFTSLEIKKRVCGMVSLKQGTTFK
ncbi:hypothetical protein SGODD07_02141 [Streptococcus gordonii]|uniref:Uncharacterized protein n=1 Tax=Streptococcus gordonii TaxID=1302 RepID=A0A139MWU6_STRGN|nr:hypothetical protein SGODD07_02141 [Streptococcus gordonii]